MMKLAYILVVLDLIEVASTILLKVDPHLSAYIFSTTIALQGALASAFYIKLDVLIADKYKEHFADFQVASSFWSSVAVFIGMGLTSLIQLIYPESIVHCLILGTVFILYQFRYLTYLRTV